MHARKRWRVRAVTDSETPAVPDSSTPHHHPRGLTCAICAASRDRSASISPEYCTMSVRLATLASASGLFLMFLALRSERSGDTWKDKGREP